MARSCRRSGGFRMASRRDVRQVGALRRGPWVAAPVRPPPSEPGSTPVQTRVVASEGRPSSPGWSRGVAAGPRAGGSRSATAQGVRRGGGGAPSRVICIASGMCADERRRSQKQAGMGARHRVPRTAARRPATGTIRPRPPPPLILEVGGGAGRTALRSASARDGRPRTQSSVSMTWSQMAGGGSRPGAALYRTPISARGAASASAAGQAGSFWRGPRGRGDRGVSSPCARRASARRLF